MHNEAEILNLLKTFEQLEITRQLEASEEDSEDCKRLVEENEQLTKILKDLTLNRMRDQDAKFML